MPTGTRFCVQGVRSPEHAPANTEVLRQAALFSITGEAVKAESHLALIRDVNRISV